MSSNSNHIDRNRLMIVTLILNAAAVVSLFFPIIEVREAYWDIFSLKLSVAGYQFIFGSGSEFVDLLLDSFDNAKAELTLLAVIFMGIPVVLTIISAVVKYMCHEKKSGSIVPIVLHTIAMVEVIFFFIVTDYYPAGGMIAFFILMVLSIVFNIMTLLTGNNVESNAIHRNRQKNVQSSEGEKGYSLKGVSGIYAGASIELDTQPIWIGRDSSQCNIILDGGKVSRKHCCIWVDNSRILIRDTSTNGVYFPNGDRMLSNIDTELHAGDTIFIGNSENSFQII